MTGVLKAPGPVLRALKGEDEPTKVPTMTHTTDIRRLNDIMRNHLPVLGQVLLTPGITSLSPERKLAVLNAVRTYDAFTKDNDPHGEHDFGAFEIGGDRVFWKIDYYDLSLEGGSPNPADPAVTRRVLTIMLANEY